MTKFKKATYIFVIGLSLFSAISCASSNFSTGSTIIDTLVDNNIITLPSINLDFINNSKIELTQSLLNKWNNTAPEMVSNLKERLDFSKNIKHFISNQIPTNGEDWFPISVDGYDTLYIISQIIQ